MLEVFTGLERRLYDAYAAGDPERVGQGRARVLRQLQSVLGLDSVEYDEGFGVAEATQAKASVFTPDGAALILRHFPKGAGGDVTSSASTRYKP